MRIGLTYDLASEYREMGCSEEEVAEFDSIEVIEAIEDVLRASGDEPFRIGNIFRLTCALARGERWDMVFNIAEGMHGFGREAQVPALLDAYGIPYVFSDPLVLALTLHKGMTKRVVRDLGISTPDFAVAECDADLRGLTLHFPVFVKPVAGGTSMGISAASKARDASELHAGASQLWRKFRQPVLIEEFLPGREFTVGLLGSGRHARAVGAMEIILQDRAEPDVYSLLNKKDWVGRVSYRIEDGELGAEARNVALQAWRGLGCRDGGRIDLRCGTGGRPQFLEVNPLPGLHPETSDLAMLCRMAGVGYVELIETIIHSAKQRMAAATGASGI